MDTGDGSHTLLNVALNETYHSRHGALRESQHVFLKEGLAYWLEKHPKAQDLSIFEMGMGTALNLILTLQAAQQLPQIKFSYTTLEAFPLSNLVIKQLNYTALLQDVSLKVLFEKVHEASWDEWHTILPNFQLKKVQQKLEEYHIENASVDLIYYDAFAPNKQAELWTLEAIGRVCSMLKSEGVFVTYSAKGQLKRDLKFLGLSVETLQGPPGKVEMVRASMMEMNE
ncbi:tRNA (5-methylaminomethyl-2-thiouridine)(34)-methyltransferase MnmD [Catalinimonas niigatensis]|uniref:tRNA (5-methylaminomethyl-2-thiouridine)(34)-methyltransferase MnmD n=1 Tax=Catalinimonas niigatensis TaxID=1397264 RepID=UPI0026661208|nr:tRNA (5-methylaminomethyl-2-thiouridine)(34)-methyltransferase MnmD [Catalinimonas niigatensis]WPP51046.1 tRNA (5-methylaminomethyl-2-thiouridine)(34)-methyltransferase MnmD [Catalinimonas niigatensis]